MEYLARLGFLAKINKKKSQGFQLISQDIRLVEKFIAIVGG